MDLIVDCSRKGVSLCLGEDELREPEAKGDALKFLLDKLLERNNAKLKDVKRVLVALGPGSFTGIRTGIAFCEGLCFSSERTLHGISTLKALSLCYNREIILHSRATFYYVGNADSEEVKQFAEAPQTHEALSIKPFAKLIDQIEPNRIQKANYLVNPYER